MGSWNNTCGLSGLPIFYDEPVTIVVIEKNNRNERCDTSAFWKPVYMPFYAKYDGSGGGIDNHGVGVDIILNGLKEWLIEKGVGENQVHDIEVKKDDLTIERFYDYVHEGRLEVKSLYGEESLIDFMMIKQSIFDDLLTNFKFTDYVGDGLGNSGENKEYRQYGFSDVMNDLPEWVRRAAENKFMMMPSNFHNVFNFGENLASGEFYKRHLYRATGEARIGTIGRASVASVIMEALQTDPELAINLLSESLKIRYLNAFMYDVRKSWAPGGLEGSQESDYDGYQFLAGAILKEIDLDFRERRELEEENESDHQSLNQFSP